MSCSADTWCWRFSPPSPRSIASSLHLECLRIIADISGFTLQIMWSLLPPDRDVIMTHTINLPPIPVHRLSTNRSTDQRCTRSHITISPVTSSSWTHAPPDSEASRPCTQFLLAWVPALTCCLLGSALLMLALLVFSCGRPSPSS